MTFKYLKNENNQIVYPRINYNKSKILNFDFFKKLKSIKNYSDIQNTLYDSPIYDTFDLK